MFLVIVSWEVISSLLIIFIVWCVEKKSCWLTDHRKNIHVKTGVLKEGVALDHSCLTNPIL